MKQIPERPSTSCSAQVGISDATVESVTKKRKRSIHAPVQGQKAVCKPNSFGTVSETSTAEVCKASDQTKVSINGTETTFIGSLLEKFNVDDSTYALARVRAAFYPKFDNEMPERKVRKRMVKLVSKGLAALEVSLKHSGSLFMYAGHEGGAYAKNSYGNIYTAVGVFVLERTFQQAWGLLATKKQQEFNEFLERTHMCISMELVTAVLGDHGQRPRKDYVVVTAVTELGSGKPKFYSAPDINVFCRKWRLPTNHVWLFSTRKSVKSFFAAYDSLNEEGTATPVCKALDEIADISVPGSIDHTEVQGEILEGLVARIVSHESLKHMKQVSKDYPLVPLEGDCTSTGHHLRPSLRKIFSANKIDEKQRKKALLESVGTSFCPNYVDWFGDEASSSSSIDVDRSVVSKFLQAHPADFSTRKLQEMIRLTQEKGIGAAKCHHNFHKIDSVAKDNLNFKMVIHVHNDLDFMKYQNEMRNKPGLWPLYRGFFLDINLFKANTESDLEFSEVMNVGQETGSDTNGEFAKDGLAEEDANLMLKLKFLPYMLRTFLMRNSLSVLFSEGEEKYKKACKSKMEKWNISEAKIRDLSEMLDKWAVYIRVLNGHKKPDTQTYLNDAEPFLEKYAKRSAKHQALIGSAGSLVRVEDLLTTIGKDEGLIVFFPGIPGCGKSALCEEILSAPGVLSDNRVILSLMGDRVKENYWGKVSEKRRKGPYSILLADKNAPNRQIWKQIEKICDNTKATAIPVVPDSEGTESNPFSLDALAVFMFRVLLRANHPGNLDKSSSVAGSVLLMFYHLYDGMSRNTFETDLLTHFGSLVKMPLLKPDRPPLPERVRYTLVEGINLYKLCTEKDKRNNRFKKFMEGKLYVEELAKWEKLLRDTLLENAEYLNSIQVPLELSVQRVVEQLKAILKGDHTPPPRTKKPKLTSIVFAAVNLPVSEIISLLDNLGAKDSNTLRFLKRSNMKSTLQKAHVTLAHIGSHGVTGVASYAHYLHENVPIHITALLFSDKLAALEVDPGHVDGEKISSKIEWPHITLWSAKGMPPKEASKLPHLLAEGKATLVKINSPVTITGTLEFY